MKKKIAMKKTAKEIPDGQGLAGAGVVDWKLQGDMYPGRVHQLSAGILYCLMLHGRKRWLAWEKKLLAYAKYGDKSPILAMEYAREIVRQRWPELESVLIPNWPYLVEYLNWKGFAKGTGSLERVILTSKKHDPVDLAHAVMQYATIVRRSRWEKGEPVILQATLLEDESSAVAQIAEAYRKTWFPRRAWPALHERIRAGKCSPSFILDYSRRAGVDCTADAEAGLLKTLDPTKPSQIAFEFARDVVRGRWINGEHLIERTPEVVLSYAREVIGDRLPEDMETVLVMRMFEDPYDLAVKAYFREFKSDRTASTLGTNGNPRA